MKIISLKDLLGARFTVVDSEDDKYYYKGNTRFSKGKMVELPSKTSRYVGQSLATFTRLEQTIIGKDGREYAIAFIKTGDFALIPMSELEDVEEKKVLSKEEALKKEFNLNSFEEFEEVIAIAKLITFSKEDGDWEITENLEKFFQESKRKKIELAIAFRNAAIAKGRDVKEATEELKILTENLL